MAVDLFIPKMGQTVEEVTLINWLINDGDKVDFGDPVMEVETDKAIFTVEANGKGYVHIGPFEKGQVVPVLTVIGTIGKKEDTFAPSVSVISPDGEAAPAKEEAPKAEAPVEEAKAADAVVEAVSTKVFASPRARKLAGAKGVDLSKVAPTGGEGVRVTESDVVAFLEKNTKSATPIAAKLAAEMNLDLSAVTGTGPKGTITREDVEKAVRQQMAAGPVTAAAPVAGEIPYAANKAIDTKPVSGVRKIIFDRMALSDQLTARVTLVSEADVTELVRFRTKLKAEKSEAWGYTPGFNEMIGLIVAQSLRKTPYMNARLSQDGTRIEMLEDVNLGFAVDTDRGLLVPVVKKADRLELKDLGAKFHALADAAKNGRISPDDLVGGTFTITNLGNFGVDAFTPVINLPELAILGLGRIQEKVVPVNGKPEIRKMMTLSLVFDHRLVDGAPAAKFLQTVRELLEDPIMIFV